VTRRPVSIDLIREISMTRNLIVLLTVWLVLLPRLVAGVTCPAMPDAASRSMFVKAERSPPKSRDALKRLRGTLGDYPLFPYVELARLRANLAHVPVHEIEAFLRRYDGEPVTFLLLRRWLRQLAGQHQWEKFVEWYTGGDSIDLRCHHARALLELGDESGALEAAERLWMSGKSRPKACDPVFEVWLRSDRFSASLAWERIGLAMTRGNTRLARYLERFLEPADRPLASAWRKVHAQPQRVHKLKLDGEASRVDSVLAHGLKRLARRDPAVAAESLDHVDAQFELGSDTRSGIVRRIGLAFATRHEPQAIDWLWRIDPEHVDNAMLQWRAAAAVRHSHWDKVIEGIDSMAEEVRGRERWRYWRARALEAIGEEDDARAGFESLARERDYYGFLAADRLGTEYRFNHRPLRVSTNASEQVAMMPGMRRALEFLALDRMVDARREWHALTGAFGEDELKAASWIARCRDWHGRAILTIARTDERDDLELRFPVAYDNIVQSASSRNDLSPAMVYAIIRQESAFMADARSSAGALGLMQLMPRTGRMLMRSTGRKLRSRSQLLDPNLNVDLGTRYIRSLLTKSGGNFVLAAASYNAGLHRARSWLPVNGKVEAAVWIDNIPFPETRRYVRRVLAYGAIYEHRLGRQQTRLSALMPPVPARANP